jgi:lysine N6-hydroxylase
VLATEKAVTDASVQSIDLADGLFRLRGPFGAARARNLALARGRKPAMPDWARSFLGARCFHVSRLLHEQPQVGGLRGVAASGLMRT